MSLDIQGTSHENPKSSKLCSYELQMKRVGGKELIWVTLPNRVLIL